MSVVATPMSSSANSFVSNDDADSYFTTRLNSSVWTDASSGNKDAALISATSLLDSIYEWVGFPTRPDVQRLRWPRAGVLDRDGRFINDQLVPEPIKAATCELAIYMLARNRSLPQGLLQSGISKAKIGPIEVEIDPEAPVSQTASDVLPEIVRILLSGFGSPQSESDGFRQVRLSRA